MGTVFYKKKNPKTWVNFSDWAQIFGFGENPENREFFWKTGIFFKKILKNG